MMDYSYTTTASATSIACRLPVTQNKAPLAKGCGSAFI